MKNRRNPLISIVIPAFNEEHFLARTLASVARQDYKNFEVIVVDNNSTDKTAHIALRGGAKVVFETRAGVAYARQKGFECARGEIIATTDADTILPENWLSKIAAKFSAKRNVVAYGGLYKLVSGPLLTRMLFPRGAYYAWKLEKRWTGCWILPGANMAVLKNVFLKSGGFNTNLKMGEDGELSKKLSRYGKVVLDKKLIVATSGRRYRKGFWAAAYGYVPNVVSRDFFGKNYKNELPPIRHESISPIAYAWPLAVVLAAATVFTHGAIFARAAKFGGSGAERIYLGAQKAGAGADAFLDAGARNVDLRVDRGVKDLRWNFHPAIKQRLRRLGNLNNGRPKNERAKWQGKMAGKNERAEMKGQNERAENFIFHF